jgi:hypothetical protein
MGRGIANLLSRHYVSVCSLEGPGGSICPIPNNRHHNDSDDRNDNAVSVWLHHRLEFQRRAELDVEIARLVQRKTSLLETTDLELHSQSADWWWQWGTDQDDWRRLRELLGKETTPVTAHVLDGLKRLAVAPLPPLLGTVEPIASEQAWPVKFWTIGSLRTYGCNGTAC